MIDLQSASVPMALIGVPLYLAPFLVGLGRWRRDRHSAASPRFLLSINVLLGWTGIGWLVAWWLAFRRTAPATDIPIQGGWVGPMPTKPIWGPGSEDDAPASPGPNWNRPPPLGWGDQGPLRQTCPTCQGSRQMVCPSSPCRGRGSWWEPPSGATGTATLVRCSYCNGNGKVQCTGPGPHP